MSRQKLIPFKSLRGWLALLAVLALAWSASCAPSPALPPDAIDAGTRTDVGTSTDVDAAVEGGTLVDTDRSAETSEPPAKLSVIVQGDPGADLAAIVAQFGGEVTRDLSVISSVAANIPADQLPALEQAESVRRVWKDAGVEYGSRWA
jgi:hypothetical protein